MSCYLGNISKCWAASEAGVVGLTAPYQLPNALGVAPSLVLEAAAACLPHLPVGTLHGLIHNASAAPYTIDIYYL